MRSQNKVASRQKRKKFIKLAKGYWGARKNVWTIAKNHIEKGLTHAYRDRKWKKRTFRKLWIIRINAAARLHGTTYSRLIHALKENNIIMNRKVLADFAMNKPAAFEAIVKQVTK
ncbi:50S ribosomal protein L20 [Bacteroidetes/Chlorobi group bacterium ChocPot_Mid]|jgi:large subunit ribosomal protein L20|nr:MAG: 50S ribosomal protein L20 [Bacteroidetes/Chlorobi group bacterium ChocPot_Mid]